MNLTGAVINQPATLGKLLQSAAEEILNYVFPGTKYGVEVTLTGEDNKPARIYK